MAGIINHFSSGFSMVFSSMLLWLLIISCFMFNSLKQPEDFEVNLTALCNMECECSPNDILPICGSDGMTYFSPCHAGCTSLTPTRGHTLVR